MNAVTAAMLAQAAFKVYQLFVQEYQTIRAGATPQEQVMLDTILAQTRADNQALTAQLEAFPNDPE